MSRLAQLARLAFADLRADWLMVFCQVSAVAAVLAPLLVLLGLKQGVIGTMLDRLDRDPEMRLVTLDVTGNRRFGPDWFAAVAALPQTGFVIPTTRKIAAQVDLFPAGGQVARPERVSLLPTAAGDPALAGAPPPPEMAAAVLSAASARRLGVAAGDRIVLAAERVRGGALETAAMPLSVFRVLPLEAHGGAAALVQGELALALEAFRDGFAVPELGVVAGEPRRPVADFVDFRLYARSIRDVAGLAGKLAGEGLAVSTHEREIGQALALERNLRAVLLLITGLSLVGYLVMVGAAQWSNVQRKRRDLAVLALIGYGPGWRVALPVVQGGLVAAAGALLALAGYRGVSLLIDLYFSASIAQGEHACRLDWSDMAGAVVATVAASLLPAVGAGILVARIDPSREIRDV